MFSYEHIRYFVEACDCGSLQAAAKNLFLSAQGLGAGIQRLENSIGIKLLTRSKSGVVPTEFGKLFYDQCQKVLHEMLALETLCSEYVSGKKNRITVGTIGTNKFLSAVSVCKEAYNQDYPDAGIDITALTLDNHLQLLDAVHNGEVDVGWFFNYGERDNFRYFQISDYSPLVFVCSNDAPIAELESVSIEALGDYKLIFADETDPFKDLIFHLFEGYGLTPSTAMYTSENTVIGRMIDSGIGCALMRQAYVKSITQFSKKSVILPVKEDIKVANSLFCSKQYPLSKEKLHFVDYMLDYLKYDIGLARTFD